MQSESTFSILFWLLRSRAKNGKAPLCIRLTVDGQRAELSGHRDVPILQWDNKAQMVKARTEEAKEINDHITTLKAKLLRCHGNLVIRDARVTAEALKNEYLGVKPERYTVQDGFKLYIKLLEEKIGKEKRAKGTLKKYKDTYGKVMSFMKHQFKLSDLFLADIKYSFVMDFENYLNIQLNLHNNTLMKHISRTKSIFKMVTDKGWITINPIVSFSCSYSYKDPLRLEMEELTWLYKKELPIQRLDRIRDTYVFMCYTGFAYKDAFLLEEENLFWGIDKQLWVAKDRQKTDVTECVPLLPVALAIIKKYKNDPYCKAHNKLLPIRSLQNFNGYLKELAVICGINKELTTHTARHTFATTVTLENDVPFETVGKMLGHKSLRSTQRYAQVTKKKMSNNMLALKDKLAADEQDNEEEIVLMQAN